MKTIILLSTLLASALGTPVPQDGYCRPSRSTKIAKYDDLTWIEGNYNPIPPHYYGLSYTTFQVDSYDGFIPPTSWNQTAMAFGGSGNISVPDQPPKTSFALQSFSYACVAGIPQPECAISIWGWTVNGNIIKREIIFPRLDPGHVIEDFKMNKTRFGKEWTGLKSVGFSIAKKEDGGNMYGGLALDDVKYTITQGC
ncbi:hypothetical protein P154DRAFT_564893 [Amniculicola lignicola CBS 123094]|uniref:Uncharacterized protein n=1 Tax=Amniculicola lignicola CBS 123094 TaxID=1392246 RepID=A0A6A5W8P1_9PLEO|nr:hypothetical protein P154DRAFT_564893 [Amniculicola lignicola CBS 123094]